METIETSVTLLPGARMEIFRNLRLGTENSRFNAFHVTGSNHVPRSFFSFSKNYLLTTLHPALMYTEYIKALSRKMDMLNIGFFHFCITRKKENKP